MPTQYTLSRSPSGVMTFRDDGTGEWLHRHFGPLHESENLYAKGCQVGTRQGHCRLADVGLGGGFNALVAIQSALENPGLESLEIHSFDTTLQGLSLLQDSIAHFEGLQVFLPLARSLLEHGEFRGTLARSSVSPNEAKPDPSEGLGEWPSKRPRESLEVRWHVHLGDAFASVRKLDPRLRFEGVFYDLFSPASSPEGWTREAFASFTTRLADDGLLATYSMATSIRAALLSLGLYVGEGPLVAPKMASTLASPSLALLQSPLESGWKDRFTRSQKAFSPCESKETQSLISKAVLSHPQWARQ